MQIVRIDRFETSIRGTMSEVSIGEVRIKGLERPWLDNAPFKSCIPTGIYYLVPHESPRFGKVHAFRGGTVSIRPNEATQRSHILWHPANRVEELAGCLATGMDWTRNGKNYIIKTGVRDCRRSMEAAARVLPLDETGIAIVRWVYQE